MSKVHAIYENGVFRPTEHVELPDDCEVEFEPRLVKGHQQQRGLDEVYVILSERYESGESDVSAQHNEHQP